MANDTRSSWISAITAISTTVAATLLLGFIGTFKDLAAQAPLTAATLQAASADLVVIKEKQAEHTLLLATMAKDYTSRDALRAEIDKVEGKIRALELQQAVLEQRLKTQR